MDANSLMACFYRQSLNLFHKRMRVMKKSHKNIARTA